MEAMEWRVSEFYTASDHRAIQYKVGSRPAIRQGRNSGAIRWRVKHLDKKAIKEATE